jgi:hypothetical protein
MMMAQINFTLDFYKFKEAISESGMSDLVKSSLVLVLNAYIESELDDYIKADSHEPTSNPTSVE